jgi:hypothetical protein
MNQSEGAPYPEHECEGCKLGKEVMVAPYSSIVGVGFIHLPEGWVCTKYIGPETYKLLQNRRKP